ncbi:MAG: hypothetical protein ACK5GZ_07895, partial [Cyanobium sp.]
PSGNACKKAIRSAVAAGSAKGREQSRQNRHQHGRTSRPVTDFQSALDPDLTVGGEETAARLKAVFGEVPAYADIPGLCKAATIAEIETQGWSLNPGRYVGVAPGEELSDEDFKAQLETLNEELEALNAQARSLEQTIAANVAGILEG